MNNTAVMLGFAVVAFLIALVLVIMIFRMLFGGRLRMPGGRARQARLGIVDAFDLDRQRQLIIVRRDNTEHLIMIGGPNDVVIEAEIIRAETRDVRDTRRDAALAPSFGDGGRIPAPMPSLETASPTDQPPPAPRPADEPMLPMPLPAAANAPPANQGAAPRGPTFPLPPRRPMPPPKLPDSVSRGDEVPAFAGQPASPAPAPPQPTPPPVSMRPPSPPQQPAPSAPPPVAPAAPVAQPPAGPTAAPPRPPFLKPPAPAAPRPPIRPLQRTTPQTPGQRPPGPPLANGPAGTPPPAGARPPGPSPMPRPGPPPAPAAAPPKAEEPAEGLESLEEEMAKLLGRGS